MHNSKKNEANKGNAQQIPSQHGQAFTHPMHTHSLYRAKKKRKDNASCDRYRLMELQAKQWKWQVSVSTRLRPTGIQQQFEEPKHKA